MPSAMSSPSEPVETVSMSMALAFLPSFMIEPLPKARSIWDSAASSALDLSIEAPSTTRRAAGAIVALLTLWPGFEGPTNGRSPALRPRQ